MKKRLLWYLLVPFILVGIYSCEYSLGDNYVEIEPPGEKPVSIDLNAVTDGENLYIYKPANLGFSLTAFGEKITGAKFKMGDKVWEFQENTGYIYISEYEFPNGIYTLSCELQIKLGDGSVADQLGGSMIGTFSWPVLVNYDTPSPIVGSRINNEGLLELYWEKPIFSHLEIKSYRIYKNNSLYEEIRIYDINQTSWVDPTYVGEEREYTLLVEVYDPYNHETIFWEIDPLTVEEMFSMEVVSTDIDFVEIQWKNGVKSHLEIHVNDEKITLEEGQTSLKLPATGFGSTAWYDQHNIVARLSPLIDPENVILTWFMTEGCFGKKVVEPYAEYTWNNTENVLYAYSSNYNVHSFSVPDLSLIKQAQTNSSHTVEEMQSDIRSSKIAVSYRGVTERANQIIVYDGKNLNETVTIPCEDLKFRRNSREKRLHFTADNKLIYFASANNVGLKGVVCNTETGEKEKEFNVYAESNIYYYSFSPDGKYVCSVEGYTTRITELDNYKIVGRKDFNMDAYDYEFNPMNPVELVTVGNNEVIIRNIKDLSVIRSFSISPATEVCNIDPLNGNILAKGENELFIFDILTGVKLFSVANKAGWPELLGNTLTSEDGMIFNLDKYVER